MSMTTRPRPTVLALIAALCAASCTRSGPGTSIPSGAAAQILIPGGQIFPESITSSRDGSVIIGSIGTHQIFRAKPGSATAQPWIKPGTDGIQSILGVFADDASSTLYACSNAMGPGGAARNPAGTLYTFDLTTGAPRGHYAFPTQGAFCNDIAVGPDGTAYATDTNNMQIVRLTKGASSLEVWAGNGAFGKRGGLLDGIAVLGHRVLVGTLGTSKLFSVPIQPDGSAGPVVEVKLDHPLHRPDGIRSFGPDTLLVVEGGSSGRLASLLAWLRGGAGRLSRVKLQGDTATVTTLKRGYPEGPVSVTVVGTTAYVLEGQLAAFYRSAGRMPTGLKPFRATATEVGSPVAPESTAGAGRL